MALVVNTNVPSLFSQRALNASTNALTVSLQRLSTGLRVNSSKDDAAGLAVSVGMVTQIRGNNQAIRNSADGISLSQTGEGALGQVTNNLQRIREIAVQAANATLNDTTRTQLQFEVDQLTQEISRIITTTNFNGIQLLNSSVNLTFQVGSFGTASNQVAITGVNVTAINGFSANLTATGIVNITTSAGASAALSGMDIALFTITQARSTYGAIQNRFEAVIANLQDYVENLSASNSRIVDADFAAETANLTRNQILQQAGTAMLSQANQAPQIALQLLR